MTDYSCFTGDELAPLPTTPEDFNAFYGRIVELYQLPDDDETRETIAGFILHGPADRAHAPLRVFGEGGLKNLANRVAYAQIQDLRAKRSAAKAPQETPADPAASNGQAE